MRTLPYLSAAVAALGLILSAPRAEAITNTAPAGIRTGIEIIDLVEPVHCRPIRHRHRRGHGWSRGCRAGVIIAPARRGVVIRERGGIQSGTTIRSRTTTRSRRGPDSRTTIRSGGGRSGVNTNIRSRDTGTSTTIRSGTGKNAAPATGTAPRGTGAGSESGAPRATGTQKSGGGAGAKSGSDSKAGAPAQSGAPSSSQPAPKQ